MVVIHARYLDLYDKVKITLPKDTVVVCVVVILF